MPGIPSNQLLKTLERLSKKKQKISVIKQAKLGLKLKTNLSLLVKLLVTRPVSSVLL